MRGAVCQDEPLLCGYAAEDLDEVPPYTVCLFVGGG